MNREFENDILALHKGFDAGERFRTNIVAGDVILDLSTRDRVRGLEILNAAEFLTSLGLPEKAKLESLDFDARTTTTVIYLKLRLKTAHREIPAMIAVPFGP